MNDQTTGGGLSARVPWITQTIATPAGPVRGVSTNWDRKDRIGAFRMRLGMGRTRYRIEPGLYAAGTPAPDSPVLVSANYKLSFDHLRRELGGLDAWILVLDTDGVNVWCAAGKGTFGTDEIVARVAQTHLADLVSHRKLIVPQLGATGVAAHEVRKQSGFSVVYGPVRAADLPAFLAAGMKADAAMRRVRFDLRDRVAVIPVEIMHWGKFMLLVAAVIVLLTGLGAGGYSLDRLFAQAPAAAVLLLGGFLAGTVFVPLLLPWLPGRAFSVKGASIGVLLIGLALAAGMIPVAGAHRALDVAAWTFLVSTLAAFLALNFTGSTTFTNLSGVRREMRVAIPIEIASAVLGMGLLVAARLV